MTALLNLASAVAWMFTLMPFVKVRCTVANPDPFRRSRQPVTGKLCGDGGVSLGNETTVIIGDDPPSHGGGYRDI